VPDSSIYEYVDNVQNTRTNGQVFSIELSELEAEMKVYDFAAQAWPEDYTIIEAREPRMLVLRQREGYLEIIDGNI
jgi:hypothetical protein